MLLDEGSSADATSPSPSLQSQRDPLCAGCLTLHKDAAPHQAQKTYQHSFNFHPQFSPPVLGHPRKMKQLALMYALRGQQQIISILEPGQKNYRKTRLSSYCKWLPRVKIPMHMLWSSSFQGAIAQQAFRILYSYCFFSLFIFCLSLYTKILLSDNTAMRKQQWFVMIWWKNSWRIRTRWCTFTAKACIFLHCCHGFIYTEQFM